METIDQAAGPPQLRDLTSADITGALRAGVKDFRTAPAFGLFFGAIFSLIGIVIFLQLLVWESTYWVLPIAAGFPLVGPFLAASLYEVSRVLERGEKPDWAAVIAAPFRQGSRQIQWMAFVSVFFYMVWVYMAHLIFALSFGLSPLTNVTSSAELLLSSEGILMIGLGSVIGGGLAVLLFAVSVISIPMLLDRDIDVVTAMVASFQSVLRNRGPMVLWGLIIAAITGVAMAPLFLGMILALPVLGHASWHLYTRAVERG
ncbi:MAG: DUF2189 domain-containing protein [Paracoccaceae bacterium]|nr:DUF2189 domain-containing protein [Paracoccaceae bacterium]